MIFQLKVGQFQYIKTTIFQFVLLLVFIFSLSTSIYSAVGLDSKNKTKIGFDNQLSFYLNQKSKNYLIEMTVNEKLLLQLIDNISRELKKQGTTANLELTLPDREIYKKSDILISEYSNEINLIVEILLEISELEKVVEELNDVNSWEKLTDLYTRIMQSLENRELNRFGKSAKHNLTLLNQKYQEEIDSLLVLYKRLNTLESKSQSSSDDQLIEEIKLQKESINNLLGNSSPTISDSISTLYFDEAKALVNILKQFDLLQSKAIQLNTELSFEIERVRRASLQNLDKQLLALMGYDSYYTDEGPSVSDIFKEWKAQQYATYKLHFTKYLAMKKALLENANPFARARMLQNDLIDAFSNYNHNQYLLAEKQFDLILQQYGAKFVGIESVLFYRAECYFIRQLYDQARDGYNRIVFEFADCEHFGESLYRLLLINERCGNEAELSKYSDILDSQSYNIDQNALNKSNYLAGYIHFKYGNFSKTRDFLSRVSNDSKFFHLARYLLGIAYINENNYSKAMEIFIDLADRYNYSKTEPYKNYIRNNALLKLGYVSYEMGKYEEALQYFNSVFSGFSEYDQILLGVAWTNLKLKNYEKSIENVDNLFKNYLVSNHMYEALVLSAHCKKMLNQQDSASEDLNYVSNSRKVLDLSNQINKNRKFILNQLTVLDHIELEIFERRDRRLYAITSHIRENLLNLLEKTQYNKTDKNLNLANIQQERQFAINQMESLQRFISETYGLNETQTFDYADSRSNKPVITIDSYQKNKSNQPVNYFLDYPLATKEGDVKYRKSIIDRLIQNMESEGQAIQGYLHQIQNLQSTLYQKNADYSAKLDLEILENELKQLQNRSSQFKTWLTKNQLTELNTDFDQNADFTGFGMSDITLSQIEEIDAKISYLAQNNTYINKILEQRKKAVEQKQFEVTKEAQEIADHKRSEEIEMEKKKAMQYFDNSYFETNEREVKKEKVKVKEPID